MYFICLHHHYIWMTCRHDNAQSHHLATTSCLEKVRLLAVGKIVCKEDTVGAVLTTLCSCFRC